MPASERELSSCPRRSRAALTAAPSPESCGTTTMKRRGPSSANCSRRSTSRPPATVWLASTSVTSNGTPPAGGLVGEHERDVERRALGVEFDHDVLDRQPRLDLEPLGEVAAHPARG